MKVVIETKVFRDALSLMDGVISKKSPIPVLGNVLLRAEGHELKVAASNLEVTLVLKVQCEVLKPGIVSINATALFGFVREVSGVDIKLESDSDYGLKVRCGQASVEFHGRDPSEYPGLPGMAYTCGISVSAMDLLSQINKTLYAVSSEEVKLSISGVNFSSSISKDGLSLLNLTSTDGVKIASSTKACESINLESDFLVPKRSIFEIKKVLEAEKDSSAKVLIDFIDGFFLIETKTSKASARLLQCDFPELHLPTDSFPDTIVELQYDEILPALKRVSVVLGLTAPGLSLKYGNGEVILEAESSHLGRAKEILASEIVGSGGRSLFQVGPLISCIQNTCSPDRPVVMEFFSAETTPVIIYSKGDKSSLVALMRVSSSVLENAEEPLFGGESGEDIEGNNPGLLDLELGNLGFR